MMNGTVTDGTEQPPTKGAGWKVRHASRRRPPSQASQLPETARSNIIDWAAAATEIDKLCEQEQPQTGLQEAGSATGSQGHRPHPRSPEAIRRI